MPLAGRTTPAAEPASCRPVPSMDNTTANLYTSPHPLTTRGFASSAPPRRRLHPQIRPHRLQRLLPPLLVPHADKGLPRVSSSSQRPRHVRPRQHLATSPSRFSPCLCAAGGVDRGRLSAREGERSEHCSESADGEPRLHELEPLKGDLSLYCRGQAAQHVPQVVNFAIPDIIGVVG